MNIFFDYKIKSNIFLTKLKLGHSEQNEESCTSCHFEALTEKSTLRHAYGFLTFVRNDRYKIRNTYFFIFISGLKQVKLTLNSISESQDFIHNRLIYRQSNLFSPLVILAVRL